jgi:hypothetical protein
MVARTRADDGSLFVIFCREGEEDEVQLAPTGERALGIALVMLAHHSRVARGRQAHGAKGLRWCGHCATRIVTFKAGADRRRPFPSRILAS